MVTVIKSHYDIYYVSADFYFIIRQKGYDDGIFATTDDWCSIKIIQYSVKNTRDMTQIVLFLNMISLYSFDYMVMCLCD